MRLGLFLFLIYCLVLNFLSSASGVEKTNRYKRYTIIERFDELDDNKFFSDQILSSELEEAERERWFNDFNPETDVEFLLFTQKNPSEPQKLLKNDTESFENSNFNPKNPIRVLIHGFRDGPGAFVNRYGTSALLENGNYNVIVVDWSKGADTINYIEARDHVFTVGPVISRFVEFIVDTYPDSVSFSNIWIIGHSLGAHVAGVAGKHTTQKVAVVVGLDPAGPFFYDDKPDERLNVGDGEYVEVIHTDRTQQGFAKPIGDADFYPNSGKKQPGCGTDLTGACSHQRAVFYWAESINTQIGFWAKPCDNYEQVVEGQCSTSSTRGPLKMGGPDSKRGIASGVYFLETASQAPFALGPLDDKTNDI